MRVMCLGDSNTYGFDPRSYFGGRYPAESRWVDILAQKTGWEILNEGENGRSIPRWDFELQLLQKTTIDDTVDLLIIMLGSNDLLQGADAELTAKRMEAFLGWLPIPLERVLLVAPPAMEPGAWVFEDRLLTESKKLAAEYKILAQKLSIWFADGSEWKVPLAFDGAHFTESGHRVFAQELLKILAAGKMEPDFDTMGKMPE